MAWSEPDTGDAGGNDSGRAPKLAATFPSCLGRCPYGFVETYKGTFLGQVRSGQVTSGPVRSEPGGDLCELPRVLAHAAAALGDAAARAGAVAVDRPERQPGQALALGVPDDPLP